MCNLRWCHNRFQTFLRRCHGGIFNFPTSKIWEIDLLGNYYTHADFQTCSIHRTAELEISILFFACTSFKLLNCHMQKQISMGYSRKNPNRGGWGYTFLKSPPANFEKKSFYPGKFCKFVWHPYALGNSKVQNQDPWKFPISFSWIPLEFPLLF